jgi:hypothetical protein
VGAGTTFADGGFGLTFTTPSFANVIVNGGYQSTGSGSLTYASGPFQSRILAPDGTGFGDLVLNFDGSSFPVKLNTTATSNFSFRNLVFGDTTGSGTGGGTLKLNETGITNVTVTGNVRLAPRDSTKSGGGFDGTTGTPGQVSLFGLPSASLAAVQLSWAPPAPTPRTGGRLRVDSRCSRAPPRSAGSTLKLANSGGVLLGGSGLTLRSARAAITWAPSSR